MDLRQYFGPVRNDEQVASLEYRLLPLVLVNVLQHVANVQTFLLRHFVLALDLPDDAYQVEQGILNFLWDLHLLTKVLAENLLDVWVANTVELL